MEETVDDIAAEMERYGERYGERHWMHYEGQYVRECARRIRAARKREKEQASGTESGEGGQ